MSRVGDPWAVGHAIGDNGRVLATPSNVAYRCPECGSIDWFHNGCVIAEVDARIELTCGRVQRPDPGLAGTTWSCNQCAHELPRESRIARDLDDLRQRTCDEP